MSCNCNTCRWSRGEITPQEYIKLEKEELKKMQKQHDEEKDEKKQFFLKWDINGSKLGISEARKEIKTKKEESNKLSVI